MKTKAIDCFTSNDPKFPIVYGGNLGATSFEAIDYDYANHNIIVGGTSSSTNIVASTNPILVYFDCHTNQVWSKYIIIP